MDRSAKSPVGAVAPNFFGNFKSDAIAGLVVFLTAVPLCVAVAKASGFPPLAGLWTAVVGGLITSFISDSQLTVKGPSAALVVVVFGAVSDLGAEVGRMEGLTETEWAGLGYKLTLGIGMTAGVIQVLLGLMRAGRLADVLPLTAAHGVLAALGFMLIFRHVSSMIGVAPTNGADPLTLVNEFAKKVAGADLGTAVIGIGSLLGLVAMQFARTKSHALRYVPGPFIVLLIALVVGRYVESPRSHAVVSSADPDNRVIQSSLTAALVVPDFRGLATDVGVRYLLLFCLIGSLESLLTAKAMELADPWGRKTHFDQDVLAVGVANAMAAAVGGLPMVSEIVRSKMNVDSGARSRAANFCHGCLLLAFVVICPGVIAHVPPAVVAALLVFAGIRLVNPYEYVRTYKLGSPQFFVFAGTILTTLTTNLWTGMAVGVGFELLSRIWSGGRLPSLKSPVIDMVPEGDDLVVLIVKRSAIKSDWQDLERIITTQAERRREIVVDLSHARLLDGAVLEKLHQMESDFAAVGKCLKLIGLEERRPPSGRSSTVYRRLAVSSGKSPERS